MTGDDSKLQQRVVELEIAVSHQQKLMEDLNRVVTEQSLMMTRLERQCHSLSEESKRLRASLDEQSGALPNEKPPHY